MIVLHLSMAPVANNNTANNNNSNVRQTGTVPKAKSSKNNVVPQEIVVPTRRDLQHHLSEFVEWSSTSHQNPGSGNYLKQSNNRNPVDESGYDIDNLALQDNSRFITVRPIVRRNLLHTEMNEPASSNQNNTTIGIVIPTPTQQTNDSLSFTSNRVSDTLSQSSISSQRSNNSNIVLPPRASVEEKLTQIQEYIKITTSLLNSMELEEPPNEGQERLIKSLENLKSSEEKLQNILNTKYDDVLSEMGSIHEDENVITSKCLENVDDEPQSMRAHSISSINTNASSVPTTPTYEELKVRLEHQTKNMQSIKDQQNQLICLQQLAKQQLAELQKVRVEQAANPNAANRVNGGPPSYDSVEQVQSDVSNLMNRMKTLTNFIQNQNDLSALLGDDGEEIMAEQLMLQKKLCELKSKKQHMDNLVAELHNYGGESGDHNQPEQDEDEEEDDRELTPTRRVPVEYQRIVPIELIGNHNGAATTNTNTTNTNHNTQRALPPARTPVTREIPIQVEQDANIEPIHEGISKADQAVINDKIAEINAMKEQLRRLKQMMDTVKEIEMDAAGDAVGSAADDGDDEHEENNERVHEIVVNKSVNREKGDSISIQAAPSPQVTKPSNTNEYFHQHTMQDTENIQSINQRVFELQSLTQDLRQQALSLAAQRDRLQIAKDEAFKKELEKERQKQAASGVRSQPTIVQQQPSQKDLEKQREQDKILKAIEKEVEQDDEKLRRQNGFLFFNENSSNSQLPTSNSSVHSNERSENLQFKKKNQASSNDMGKLSADSGAADMFGVNIDVGSIKSDSVRSLNIGPTSLPERNSHSQHHTMQNSNYCMSSRGYCSPWMMQHYQCNQYGDCQSPGWHYPTAGYNHAGGGQDHMHHCQGNFPPFTNDSSMFQEFLQTQQLLVNTICKCNELLWSQQKEINNLNHAVVWLQEKFLAQNASIDSNQAPEIRAESVPPLASAGMQIPNYFQRAQSEIPPPLRPIINNNLYQTSPMRTNRPPSNLQPNLFPNTNDMVNHQQQRQTSSVYHNHFLLNAAQSTQQNESMIHNQPLNNNNNHPMASNHGDTTPIFMHHNNNINSSNNNNNINNKLYHGTPRANANQSALNNKVPPGNRANNYWDNFRSYSRQNLLSTNSCKSNDGSYCMSTNQSNFQQQQHNVNIDRLSLRNQQSMSNYNNLANNFRNQINPVNVSTRYHDTAVSINLNQPGEAETMGNPPPPPPEASINLCSADDNSAPNQDANYIQAASLLQFHTNPINLGVCDFSAKYKTPPKRYDNNMKYLQQYLRSNDSHNTFEQSSSSSTIQNIDIDLNLFNRMSTTQQNKPTSKIFDELKENVYQEVSALIAANETRPHFLIQLFRELQLISSDPLRQRALQSIQDLYNRYLDSTNYNEPSSSNNVVDEMLSEKCIPEETQVNQQNTGNSSNFDHLQDIPNENREIPREPE